MHRRIRDVVIQMNTDLDLFGELPEVGSWWRHIGMHRDAEVTQVTQRRYCWVEVRMEGWHTERDRYGIPYDRNGVYLEEYTLRDFLIRFEAIA